MRATPYRGKRPPHEPPAMWAMVLVLGLYAVAVSMGVALVVNAVKFWIEAVTK